MQAFYAWFKGSLCWRFGLLCAGILLVLGGGSIVVWPSYLNTFQHRELVEKKAYFSMQLLQIRLETLVAQGALHETTFVSFHNTESLFSRVDVLSEQGRLISSADASGFRPLPSFQLERCVKWAAATPLFLETTAEGLKKYCLPLRDPVQKRMGILSVHVNPLAQEAYPVGTRPFSVGLFVLGSIVSGLFVTLCLGIVYRRWEHNAVSSEKDHQILARLTRKLTQLEEELHDLFHHDLPKK